jgi:hypothetical protein
MDLEGEAIYLNNDSKNILNRIIKRELKTMLEIQKTYMQENQYVTTSIIKTY